MNRKIILPILLSGLMIISILGFAFNSMNSDTSRTKYKGNTMFQTENGFAILKDNSQINIQNNPKELENITMPEISINEINSGNKIYFTFNPEENVQISLYYFDLNIRPKLKNFIVACTSDVEKCQDLPLKTCEDADLNSKVIQVQLSNSSSITYENNCLLIQGQKEELSKLVDALILKLLL